MDPRPSGVRRAVRVPQRVDARRGRLLRAREQHRDRGRARRELEGEGEERPRAADERGARSSRRRDVARVGRARIRRGAFYTLVPIRPRRRGERRSLRTFAGASLRPHLAAFNPRPRRLSTPSDAFELHPDRDVDQRRRLAAVHSSDAAQRAPVRELVHMLRDLRRRAPRRRDGRVRHRRGLQARVVDGGAREDAEGGRSVDREHDQVRFVFHPPLGFNILSRPLSTDR